MADGRRGRVMPRGVESIAFRHGHATEHGGKSRTYISWRSMRARCLDPKHPGFDIWGGRGITICARWDDFDLFLADMGERPPGASLDRWPNNDGNYEPSNCRWATPKQQAQNTRTNNMLTANGVTKCITEWARDLGVDPGAIRYRLRAGWSVERAVSEPRRPYVRKELSLA